MLLVHPYKIAQARHLYKEKESRLNARSRVLALIFVIATVHSQEADEDVPCTIDIAIEFEAARRTLEHLAPTQILANVAGVT